MVLGCPLDLFFFPLVPKNQSKGIYKNCWVHLDMLSNWICNFILTTVWEQYFEILPHLKIRKVDQTQRNHTQNDRWYSPGKQGICCWASKHLQAIVSTVADCLIMTLTYEPSYPCWNFTFSLSKFSISQISLFLFRPLHNLIWLLICLRKRSMTYF